MRTSWVSAAVLLAVGIVLVVLAGMLPGALAPIGYVLGVVLVVIGVLLLLARILGSAP